MELRIKSMTGYGKGVCELVDKKVTVEIRTLNSKQIDLNLKMPAMFRDSDINLRSLLAKGLERGKADIYVNVEYINGKKSPLINTDVVNDYYNQLKELNIEFSGADFLQTIMRLPEVMQTEVKAETTPEDTAALFAAANEAIKNINAFREQEGKVMIADILDRITNIENLKTEILQYDTERTEAIRNRIREAIDKLGVTVDENRFEQEMIFYLEKLDITEEKVRLQNHLDYFRSVCETEENVGRKLGFIAQEIGREINTTGSKSNHTQMQQIVVRMKDELEKIKEQSLNIL